VLEPVGTVPDLHDVCAGCTLNETADQHPPRVRNIVLDRPSLSKPVEHMANGLLVGADAENLVPGGDRLGDVVAVEK
jgi:hypothetical protein